ncbi:DMT family transporter [Vibrio parahaemolyticus]|uniref:DMT family transporter n=1 Tax=Vibrio parahaemolyticus TaxID=670 RepID=UPI0002A59326|nr:DMT family transporter [Vibrio parahaemolyticus]AGB12814.1 Permease of the transporter (DMT) superfamily [Vibrio parahaemolyticus BB22OP]EGR0436887.1 DMT family transporter [Vibrio parahaemolyticus]EGR0764371.1 DMT family transporter [Vibrio parahaemolyticus]EGR2565079.1 DMT family transporter [Vibrio parahaemolyticus]EGR3327524.1 EamA/RhaT family transporter [Vibrio parahaemolyticus]
MSTFLLTAITMLAFAANSLLCRLALAEGLIDAGSFTLVRLISGAITLIALLVVRGQWKTDLPTSRFRFFAGVALFGYAALFSFAYLQLSTGTGALLLFGAVQLTLLAIYWWQGERFQFLEIIGIGLSIVGFVWLMLPSATRPDISSALLMLISGVCWAAFTALGKQAPSPSSGITWGFIAASMIGILLSPLMLSSIYLSLSGILLAITSGAIASGLGYTLWYQVMRKLSLLQAAVSQLSVPAIALLLGTVVLHESLSLHTLLTSGIILGGIALVFLSRSKKTSEQSASR